MAHSKSQNACLVCGKELIYHEESVEMECIYCHKKFMSNAACADGHYVCDTCHSKKGIEAVKEICLHSKSKNPYEIAVQMMETPFIHMHGPENHVLVGAALLAAYKNAGGDIELDTGIEEMKKRSQHRDLCQSRHRCHTFKRKKLGSFQSDDIQGTGTNRSH